jgi:hypothetical protein
MITFGGDLAGTLTPFVTPTTITAGDMPVFHFDSGDVTDVGRVSGDVVLANDPTATAGSITVTNFSFVSFAPFGAGPISFTIDVSQDYDYNGPAQTLGSESLAGAYTFTEFPQGGAVTLTTAVNTFVLPPILDSGASNPPPFPQTVLINPFPPPNQTIAALMPMHLDLILGASLSDNASGSGPRLDMSIAQVSYAAVPEPGSLTQLVIGAGVLALRYAARRGRGGAATTTPPEDRKMGFLRRC